MGVGVHPSVGQLAVAGDRRSMSKLGTLRGVSSCVESAGEHKPMGVVWAGIVVGAGGSTTRRRRILDQ